MPDSEDQPRPARFAAALDAIRHASPRAELVVTEIAAPGNLAPYSVALSADVAPVRHGSDSDFGTGRFILLYDPAEPESWGGPFRVVCFAQAPLETDIGVDPFLAEVAWAWLVDALDTRGARYAAASGTATKVLSSGFGELARQGDGAQIELRASWSPLDDNLAAHVEGWGELLCMLAGLPPAGEPPTQPRRGRPGSAPGPNHGHPSTPNSINLGPIDPIGPSSAPAMRRTGPTLHTLGVVATTLSGDASSVGGGLAGLNHPIGESADKEPVRMNTVRMHSEQPTTSTPDGTPAIDRSSFVGHANPTGPGAPAQGLPAGSSGLPGLAPPAMGAVGVTDLSAHRAARG